MIESTSELVREASDPKTHATRLSQLLDICDAPRREFARLVTAALTPKMQEARGERLAHAASYLENATHDHLLGVALAGNPNLSREDWVRALEIEPAAAIRNPLFKLLVAQRVRIIERFHELLALGSLAKYATARPEDIDAPPALIELVCAGLPDLDTIENFGGNFGETGSGDMPVTAANRYCWNGDGLWSFRAVAVHRAGVAVMDLLQRTTAEGAAEAICICEGVGDRLTCRSDRWNLNVGRIPFAPAAEEKFSYTLITLYDNHKDLDVVGWSGPDGVHWVREQRPGFHRGSTSEAMPRDIPIALHCTDCDLSGLGDGIGMEVRHGEVIMIWQGTEATRGCAYLEGCRIDASFPEEQLKRLTMLFGEDSDAVRFGRNPMQAICDECGEFDLVWYADEDDSQFLPWYLGEECGNCGAARDTED